VAAFAIGAFGCQLRNRLNCDTAGDFARVVAAHAIREHHQAIIDIRADSVLVVLPNPAGIGDFSEF